MAKTMDFGHDGDDGLGDRLLAAVLRGEKTATSSLAIGYLSGDPLPRVGERLPLVDHTGGVHGTVEITRVTIIPLHLVGDNVARDEGEGFANAAEWRRDHVAYSTELTGVLRVKAGDPGWELREAEPSSCSGSGSWSPIAPRPGLSSIPLHDPQIMNAEAG